MDQDEAFSSRQLLLGSDKRHPFVDLYESKDEQFIHVCYGFELVETLPNNPELPAYKMMGGRL